MAQSASVKKANFTEGPLLKKMILFAIPIPVSGQRSKKR